MFLLIGVAALSLSATVANNPLQSLPVRERYGVGTSKFGKGAQSRLIKYEGRRGVEKLGPTNLICSEMCVLAYQMACRDENHEGFIRLDAKHTTPATLCRHLLDDDNWTLLGKYGM